MVCLSLISGCLGSLGQDDSGKMLVREMEKAGVVGVYQEHGNCCTGECLVLITDSHRTLVTRLVIGPELSQAAF